MPITSHTGDHEGDDERRSRLVMGDETGDGEDPGADDAPDPEGGETDRPQHSPEPVLTLHSFVHLAERLAGKELLHAPPALVLSPPARAGPGRTQDCAREPVAPSGRTLKG
ncbi:hypothetical protein LLH03_13860 [bacterium]|nr:hypothetical protein [bacterium]